MIDVIFLLLTFFIYSMVLMVQAQVLPVHLAPVATGQRAKPAKIEAITIDRTGRLYLDRKPITREQLDAHLKTLAEQAHPPKVFVAAERSDGPTTVDRLPVLWSLIGRLERSGLDVSLVGLPETKAGTGAGAARAPAGDGP